MNHHRERTYQKIIFFLYDFNKFPSPTIHLLTHSLLIERMEQMEGIKRKTQKKNLHFESFKFYSFSNELKVNDDIK